MIFSVSVLSSLLLTTLCAYTALFVCAEKSHEQAFVLLKQIFRFPAFIIWYLLFMSVFLSLLFWMLGFATKREFSKKKRSASM